MSSHYLEGVAAQLSIDVASEKIAKTVFRAIQPETKSVPSERAKTTVQVDESVLLIDIDASDLTALRAAMNSFLAWISACLETAQTI